MVAQSFVVGFLLVVRVDLFTTLEKRDVSNVCYRRFKCVFQILVVSVIQVV